MLLLKKSFRLCLSGIYEKTTSSACIQIPERALRTEKQQSFEEGLIEKCLVKCSCQVFDQHSKMRCPTFLYQALLESKEMTLMQLYTNNLHLPTTVALPFVMGQFQSGYFRKYRLFLRHPNVTNHS